MGTYGVSSAACWWGRLAAIFHRVVMRLMGRLLAMWLLLFADDWNAMSDRRRLEIKIAFLVFFCGLMGIPLSWCKVNGGKLYAWIGYELNLQELTLGISDRRAAWLIGWFVRVLEKGTVGARRC